MTRTVAVTSFGPKGWEQYGRRFVKTFARFWPREVTLFAYHEGQPADDFADWAGERLHFINLIEASADLRAFLARHDNNPVVKGRAQHPGGMAWKPKWIADGYAFRFDAWKFCRKVFAIADAAEVAFKLNGGGARLFWTDADIVTFRPVPEAVFEALLPGGYTLSYLGRAPYHSECGFVGYRLPDALPFIRRFAATYATDAFMSMREWHDSYVFDETRKQVGGRHHNLSETCTREHRRHPFIVHPILGRYMDHLKGDAYKRDGVSAEHPCRHQILAWK